MRGLSAFVLASAATLGAWSCGGAFSASADGDDGGAADGAKPDAVSADATADAVPDALDEPPPHCAGAFACVPGVPPGWLGPVELYADIASAPACTSNFAGPVDGHDLLNAPAGNCGCTCDIPQAQCSSPTISFYCNNSSCGPLSHAADVVLVPGACTTVDESSQCMASVGGMGMTAPASVPGATSCNPAATKDIAPPTWGVSARACSSVFAATQVDCPSGSVCAPTSAPPFRSGLCVSTVGDVACPTTGYTVRHVYFESVVDTRDCSACTCGDVKGASCSATINVFSSTNLSCGSGDIMFLPPFTCDPAQQPADFRLDISSTNGSCTPSTVAPTGSASPSLAATFCCAP